MDKPDPDEPALFGTADFHDLAHKQILNAVFSALSEAKMDWATIAPLLDGARDVVLGDFEETARIRLHTMRAEGDGWVEAEEAYIGITAADRETGEQWLEESFWLSDLATVENDRTEVEAIVRALERSIAKLRDWLENPPPLDMAEAGPAEAKPASEGESPRA